MGTEFIIHACVKSHDGERFKGKCHADCFFQMHKKGIKASHKALDQGFITNYGRYVDRKEGAFIAMNSKQVSKYVTVLFSEDLWCERDGGLHNYDESMGYYK